MNLNLFIKNLFSRCIGIIGSPKTEWIKIKGEEGSFFQLVVNFLFPLLILTAVASMIGLAGFAGAIGGIIFAWAVGRILEFTGSYYIVFGIASWAYLLCWVFLKIFVPDDRIIIIK